MPLEDFYISGLAGDFPQPFPATICEVAPIVEPALDVLCSSGQLVESQHTQDIMVSSSNTMESTGLCFMQKEFQAATDMVLAKAIEGLTPSALRDPRHRA